MGVASGALLAAHLPALEALLRALPDPWGQAAGLAATTALVAAAGGLTYASAIEPGWVEVREVELRLPRLGEAFDGYRIAHLSDLHTGEPHAVERVEAAVDLVNGLAPDLTVLTGDFVSWLHPSAVEDVALPLRRLRSRDGALAITGNHDYWATPDGRRDFAEPGPVRDALREAGIAELAGSHITLERGRDLLHFAGLESVLARPPDLDTPVAAMPRAGAAVLLCHEPDFADRTAGSGRFDLQLSGHSHGGQVRLPLLPPPHLPRLAHKYHTGLYRVREMQQYTNRGIGVVGVPFRLFSRPEITVYTLRPGVSDQPGRRWLLGKGNRTC